MGVICCVKLAWHKDLHECRLAVGLRLGVSRFCVTHNVLGHFPKLILAFHRLNSSVQGTESVFRDPGRRSWWTGMVSSLQRKIYDEIVPPSRRGRTQPRPTSHPSPPARRLIRKATHANGINGKGSETTLSCLRCRRSKVRERRREAVGNLLDSVSLLCLKKFLCLPPFSVLRQDATGKSLARCV